MVGKPKPAPVATPPKEAPRQPPKLRTAKLSVAKEFTNILYFGNEGTGKTTDLASMAYGGRVLYINAEAGIKRRPMVAAGIPVDNIELWPDPESGEEITYDGMENVFIAVREEILDDPGSWYAVAMDSGTEIVRVLLEDIVDKRVAKAEKEAKQGKTVADVMRNKFWTDQGEWGEMSNQVRSLVRKFRDLPCHFGMACLMRRDKDDDGKVKYGPAVNPALQGDLAGWVDVLVRTEVEEVNGGDIYQGHFRPSGKYRGKDRFGLVPRLLIDPTFDRVQAYIEERLTTATDDVQRSTAAEREGVAAKQELGKAAIKRSRTTTAKGRREATEEE